MRKLIVVLLLIGSVSASQAQEKKVIEDFINQIYKEFVPAGFEYYNLFDSGVTREIRSTNIPKNDIETVLKKHPDFPIEFFKSHTIPPFINWREYHLEKARIYSNRDLPKYPVQIVVSRLVDYDISKADLDSIEKHKQFWEVIVPVKSSWSSERIQKERNDVWKKLQQTTRREDKLSFSFSAPIFSENGQYAMITLSQSGSSGSYIFKHSGDIWIRILAFDFWVS